MGLLTVDYGNVFNANVVNVSSNSIALSSTHHYTLYTYTILYIILYTLISDLQSVAEILNTHFVSIGQTTNTIHKGLTENSTITEIIR